MFWGSLPIYDPKNSSGFILTKSRTVAVADPTLVPARTNFENKGPEMLNDVDALADRKNSRGTYVEIEKKRAMDVSGRELFSNKKQVLQYKSLIGVIEGKGCLCSYDNYKLSEKMKYLSASEFERHAGCKGGHANSHIYFDSGKTIHVVAQNLKKTPPEMLFESTYKVLKNIILQKMKRQNHCDLLIDQGRGSSTISQ
ncbi:uncharacterized protein [Solanum tuberosum]|uniref:uncharacterized protein n=1 Tax=Solanum tuberosum TaxID=4113 RepID=UPI00073A4C50|nr:PREDICTED: uncharacterized protein LOC107062171 [Solanum tuberosum]